MTEKIQYIANEMSGKYSIEEEKSYKIPFSFAPMPFDLLDDEFLEDPIMMKYIKFIFNRISTKPNQWKDKKKGFCVDLEPYEFVTGRFSCMEETGLSESNVVSRQKRLISLEYIRQVTSKSTSQFSVYILCTESFCKKALHPNHQPSHQGPHQPSHHKLELRTKNIDSRELLTSKESSPESSSSFSQNENSFLENNEESISSPFFDSQHNIIDSIGRSSESRSYDQKPPSSNQEKVTPKNASSKPKIYDCLKNLKIQNQTLNDLQKMQITRDFSEDLIKNKIQYCKVYKNPIGDLGSFLYQACKNNYEKKISIEEINKSKEVEIQRLIEKNRNWMNDIKNLMSLSSGDLKIFDTSAEIKEGLGFTRVGFSESSFQERIECHLRKIGKWDLHIPQEM